MSSYVYTLSVAKFLEKFLKVRFGDELSGFCLIEIQFVLLLCNAVHIFGSREFYSDLMGEVAVAVGSRE